jgi:hypothetical protein
MQQSVSHPSLSIPVQEGQSHFFATVSLVIGLLVWATEIFVPLICFGFGGVRWTDVEVVGTDAMQAAHTGVFLVILALASAGFLGIVGVVIGLLGATLGSRSRWQAIVGIGLNATGWIAAAIFFLASFGG